MSQRPRQLDSRIEIVTPENIAFHYTLAGPFRRLPAYLLDCTFRLMTLIVILVLALISGVSGAIDIGLGVFFVAWFLLSWFYGGLFETLWNGQTPGKRLTRIRVLSIDGQPINAWQAILRNVLRDVDAMPMIGAGVEFAVPLYTLGLGGRDAEPPLRPLGRSGSRYDRGGRTAFCARRAGTHRWLGRGRAGSRLPVNLVVRRSLARAMSVYISRRKLFSPARRYELALILADPLAKTWNLPAAIDPDLLHVRGLPPRVYWRPNRF